MFLRERLKALQDGWAELQKMWENRQQVLSQSLSYQLFDRDAKQAEVLLTQQEHVLSRDKTPVNLEEAENLLKNHETFLATLDANEDKIVAIVQNAKQLCSEDDGLDHGTAEKIVRRADTVEHKLMNNKDRALQQLDKLKDQLELQQFMRDCDELLEWIKEKLITAQDETYRYDCANISRRLKCFQIWSFITFETI